MRLDCVSSIQKENGKVQRNMLLTGPGYYANPSGSFGNASFGRVTGITAQTERMIRFGGRFLF